MSDDAPRTNRIGLGPEAYKGLRSTLCAGCGHNSISERIVEAMYHLGVAPERVAKLSGIGCSAKSPAYFMSRSHAFNGVHGRMPSLATGAILANRSLLALGVSGDGDTGSIGVGQFVHLARRNVPIVYVVEDNGVYGLTKGQFSATADPDSKAKGGAPSALPAVDLCALAIQVGASFVARSFSGDKRQLLALLQAAVSHRGAAILDVISPCVTFNDHEGSTRSYAYVKEHDDPLQELSFVPAFEAVTAEYEAGTSTAIALHDGSRLVLRKLEEGYDPSDRVAALGRIARAREAGEILTGLFFLDPSAPTFLDRLSLDARPLATLPEEAVRPPREVLEAVLDTLR